jgi:hypothetical protein
VAFRDVDAVPVDLQDPILELCNNYSLMSYALETVRPIPPKHDVMILLQAIADINDFLRNSSHVSVPTVKALAAHVNVAVSRSKKTDFVESVLLTTDRSKANGRDVFVKYDNIGPFETIYAQNDLALAVEGLMASDSDVFPQDEVNDALLNAVSEQPLVKGLVMDFTAINEYDRDLLAAVVAISRSTRVVVQPGVNSADSPSLIYTCRPNQKIAGIDQAIVLDDTFTTDDPREVIALTGEQKAQYSFAGFNCQLRLDNEGRNLIQIENEDAFIVQLDNPLYKSTITAARNGGEKEKLS